MKFTKTIGKIALTYEAETPEKIVALTKAIKNNNSKEIEANVNKNFYVYENNFIHQRVGVIATDDSQALAYAFDYLENMRYSKEQIIPLNLVKKESLSNDIPLGAIMATPSY